MGNNHGIPDQDTQSEGTSHDTDSDMNTDVNTDMNNVMNTDMNNVMNNVMITDITEPAVHALCNENEHKAVRPSYQPSVESVKIVNEINSLARELVTPAVESYDLDSVVTLDLLDFDASFPCPICRLTGEETLLTVTTVSDHVSRHKYEMILAERQIAKLAKVDEMADIKAMIPGFNRAQLDDSDSDSDSDNDNINEAIQMSMKESELLGGMNEEDAIAHAIAASESTCAIYPPTEHVRGKRQSLQRIEATEVDCNDINCD